MPKKKKTRKQKILSDNREKISPVSIPSQQTPTYSVASVQKEEKTPLHKAPSLNKPAAHASTIDYSYLSKDLFKTLALTGSIIIAEIGLLFLTKGM